MAHACDVAQNAELLKQLTELRKEVLHCALAAAPEFVFTIHQHS